MNNYIINKSVRNDYIKEKERSSYRYGMVVFNFKFDTNFYNFSYFSCNKKY